MVKGPEGIGKSFFVQQYEKAARGPEEGAFKKTLDQLMDTVSSTETAAGQKTQSVLAGAPVDSHDVMIAAQEAGLAFELMLEIRNKLIEAYQELIRMQV